MILKFKEYNESKFINADDEFPSTEEIDKDKIDNFIDIFNEYIKSKHGKFDTVKSYVLNNTIGVGEKLPWLNDTEFKHTIKLAKEEGWELSKKPDNYQTTMYIMKKI